MISVEEALARITRAFAPLAPETVSLADALGRVLAEDVRARADQPPVAVSAMDGYAVRSGDVAQPPVTLKEVGCAPAGGVFEGELGAGQAVRIFTGAPVPKGADAIVIQENAQAQDGRITVRESAPPGRFIRPAGLDFSEGEVGLEAGRTLTARDIGLAAAMNRPWLAVRRQPRVAILATGDEIVMPGEALAESQIVSSNALALSAAINAFGGLSVNLGIARDDRDSLKGLAEGARGADLFITTGGVSVGEKDLVRSVLEEMGCIFDFWKIAMRPGKPVTFGRLGETPMLGLPGNPVSVLVCALVFIKPAFRVMLGQALDRRPAETARLGSALKPNDERQDYLRARLSLEPDGTLLARPFEKQDSSMISRISKADCLIVRPPFAPAAEPGESVEILRFAPDRLSF